MTGVERRCILPVMPNDTQDRQLWRMKDLLANLDISESTARRWIRDKGLPYFKPGGEYRFDPDAVWGWLREITEEEPDE